MTIAPKMQIGGARIMDRKAAAPACGTQAGTTPELKVHQKVMTAQV
jgi:hypothetical protein